MTMSHYTFYRLQLETASAIHPGSGESDLTQDMPIQMDVNGLPTIHASSIAGVLRSLYRADYSEAETNALFGYQQRDEGSGSRLLISDALVLNDQGSPVEGIQTREPASQSYLRGLQHLPKRDHCRLSIYGTAAINGKFDRTVLPAGVRFMLEFEVIGDDAAWCREQSERIYNLFHHPLFRLGGGTRNGFGQIKVLAATRAGYDLSDREQRRAFLKRSASLLVKSPDEVAVPLPTASDTGHPAIKQWHITLEAEETWLFGDGTGEGSLDIRPKKEQRVQWTDGQPDFRYDYLLPASSVKGALAHRTAYHFNKQQGRFAEDLSQEQLEEPCPAVLELFGSAKSKNHPGSRGKLLISDMYCENPEKKVLNHVSLDRFTGGVRDGMLFTEQVLLGGTLSLHIVLTDTVPPEYEQAFTAALDDLQQGRLPLGGGVMRGHGAMKTRKGE
ncbi:MAG: hypothetical protein GX945_00175 [Lentisphaerae bacterium]|nr:hypothetical protein [Lentisphaerota bacterium]